MLDRARNQVEKAISEVNTGQRVSDKQTEISAFAAALIFVIATKNNWVKKRYALAVAKLRLREMLNEKRRKSSSHSQRFRLGHNRRSTLQGLPVRIQFLPQKRSSHAWLRMETHQPSHGQRLRLLKQRQNRPATAGRNQEPSGEALGRSGTQKPPRRNQPNRT